MEGSPTTIIDLSKLVPLAVFLATVAGVLIGKFKYKISILQSLEKIANEQEEYRKKASYDALKKTIAQKHILLGNNFLDVGNWSAAKVEFKAALAIDLVNEAASMGLFKSQVYDNIENYGITLEIVEKKINFILKHNPYDAHGYYLLGLLYKDIDYEKALDHFKMAVAFNPELPDAHYRIGMIYETQNAYNTTDALVCYEAALALSKFNQTYLNNLAYQYLQLGHPEKAIMKYDLLIKIDSSDLLPYLTISTAYLRVHDFSNSVHYVNKYTDTIQRRPEIMDTKLNQMHWFFESFEKEKIILDTVDKKMLYGSMSAFYKNLLAGNTERANYHMDRAAKLFDTNRFDNAKVRELIEFEITEYVPNIVSYAPSAITVDIIRELLQQGLDQKELL